MYNEFSTNYGQKIKKLFHFILAYSAPLRDCVSLTSYDFAENKIWITNLAIDYYRAFASQYISFITRNPKLVTDHLSLKQIKEFGVNNSITTLVNYVEFLIENKELGGSNELMWKTACSAPHRLAAVLDTKFLVILDEFQNLTVF